MAAAAALPMIIMQEGAPVSVPLLKEAGFLPSVSRPAPAPAVLEALGAGLPWAAWASLLRVAALGPWVGAYLPHRAPALQALPCGHLGDERNWRAVRKRDSLLPLPF